MRKLQNFFKAIAPGIITAALIFGPSKMTITSKLGAQFGYSLLWIVVIAIFFMAAFSSMATRMGTVLDDSILGIVAKKWGRWASVVLGFAIFAVAASFQSGNSTGVGIAIGELTNTQPYIWIVVFNAIGILLLFTKNIYKTLEKVMVALIIMMLLSFLITLFIIKPDLSGVLSGLKPVIPEKSLGLVIAFGASCISIVGAFYQAYLIREKKKIQKDNSVKYDGVFGIIILGVMSAIVMICAAAVLLPNGIDVKSATDMSRALVPAFGNFAAYIFLIGLFGAAFSSLVGNASVGGTLLSDAFGWSEGVGGKRARILTALVMTIGALVAIMFGSAPLELIVFAQSVTIFIVPVIGFTMYFIANDKKLMGIYVNSLSTKIVIGTAMILIVMMAIFNFKELFLK